MASSVAQEHVFEGHGLSRFKFAITTLLVIGVVVLVLWIAIHEGVSALGSTIVALLFILGFIYYLRLIAPIPFTIRLEPDKLVKANRKGEVVEVRWEDLDRIKEEFFKNGTRIGVSAYRRVVGPGQKAKAWSVYRDDVNDIDGLAAALKQAIPPTCKWQSETVHD